MKAEVVVMVGDRIIQNPDIRDLVIFENVFTKLPTLSLILSDQNGVFIRNPIKDGDFVSVFMSPGGKDSPFIQTVFDVFNFTIQESTDSEGSAFMVYISGVLYVENAYDATTGKSYAGNSSDVCKTLANELKLQSDIRAQSVDQMNWIRCKGTNRISFMKHLEDRAYVDKADFPFIRINRDKKLVYSSYQNEIQKDSKVVFYKTASEFPSKSDDKRTIIPVSSWKQITHAGAFNRKFGYGVKHQFYTDMENLEDDIYYDDPAKTGVNTPQKDKTQNKIRVKAINSGHQSVNVHDAFNSTKVQNAYSKYSFLNTFVEVGIGGSNLQDEAPKLLEPGNVVDFVDMFNATEMNLNVSGKYFTFAVTFSFNNSDVEISVVLARGGNNTIQS